jgi:hypothetical protein
VHFSPEKSLVEKKMDTGFEYNPSRLAGNHETGFDSSFFPDHL